MNLQNIMKEAQKIQSEIQKAQQQLESEIFLGEASLVKVKINGKKEVLEISIDNKESLEKEDLELLEDMIVVAFNDAIKKVDKEKESKLGKYGNGLSGLL